MSSDRTLAPLVDQLCATVRQVIGEIRPRLVQAALSGDRGESDNLRHTDNFLSIHDVWLHHRYRELLAEYIPAFVYASEEADPQIVGDDPDPDLCVLVDPLDTSELAVRCLNGYTHVMIYSRSLTRPIVAVVGDIFHHIQLYAGARDETGIDQAQVITADGQATRLGPTPAKPLREALVTNYSMRPEERFVPLAGQHDFIRALSRRAPDGKARGRIGVDFGSVSLCHVAAGFTDAVIEFAKGFAVWDLSPGHYILHAAGGTAVDLHGHPISLDLGFDSLQDIAAAMSGRQTFVAAGTPELAQEIVATLR